MSVTTPDPVKQRTSVALAPEIVELGKSGAKRERRSFSNYVEWLIERDAKAEAAEAQPSTTEAGS